ncbi:hypothetical protein AB1Y20_019917 [Prymnesium parvum]|uniref:Uncharacterized protein n=1 Tax=Prymnesium parvum TaxID=97485 RepID=A0AB34JS72_PRYPA
MAARLLLLALCLPLAAGFQLAQAPALRPVGRAVVCPKSSVFRMQEESSKTPAEPAPAPESSALEFKPASPPAEEKKGFLEDFDITQYSMTISIFVVFVIVKTLSALGIIDLVD